MNDNLRRDALLFVHQILLVQIMLSISRLSPDRADYLDALREATISSFENSADYRAAPDEFKEMAKEHATAHLSVTKNSLNA
tara:strand:+ start:433 stop:678 length:246 start_codon:yes stop_codon:yes gene_type:complete